MLSKSFCPPPPFFFLWKRQPKWLQLPALDIKNHSVQAAYIRCIIHFMIAVISAYLLFQIHNQSFYYLCFKQKTNKKLNTQISIITQDWQRRYKSFPKPSGTTNKQMFPTIDNEVHKTSITVSNFPLSFLKWQDRREKPLYVSEVVLLLHITDGV